MNATNLNMTVTPQDYKKGFFMDSFCKENPQFNSEHLAMMGITFSDRAINNPEYKKFLDQGLVNGTPSITTPIQFAQFWIPDIIEALYRARSFNRIFGSKNIGTWELEQIVYTKLTLTGRPNVYDDFSRANLTSYNLNFETRDTLRVEQAIEVTLLEQARAAQMRQNAHNLKKEANALSFDIFDNHTKWFGFNDGAKKIYGMLSAPEGDLVKYNTPGNKAMSAMTMLEICTMLNGMVQTEMNRLQGNYVPERDVARLVLPLSCRAYMAIQNEYGRTPMKWLNETYPKIEVETAAELDGAGSDGKNIAIFYVPEVDGLGTDRASVAAYDTSKLRLIGAVPTVKGFEEAYSFSTAGVIHRCPLAISLWEGV